MLCENVTVWQCIFTRQQSYTETITLVQSIDQYGISACDCSIKFVTLENGMLRDRTVSG